MRSSPLKYKEEKEKEAILMYQTKLESNEVTISADVFYTFQFLFFKKKNLNFFSALIVDDLRRLREPILRK